MIDQLSVFLENKKGHLASACRVLADAGVNMTALTIAETSDFGLVRIICDDPEKAKEALDEGGYRSTITKVCAVEVPNYPGGLAKLLELLDEQGVNLEYGYCFSSMGEHAVDVLKIANRDRMNEAAEALEKAGFKLLDSEDLF